MVRPAMLLIILLAVSLSLTLFAVKYQVQDLEEELVGYNRGITENRQAIHVLKAEWSYLNQPARLKDLAERYLEMVSVEPRQVGTAAEFLANFPARTPEAGGPVLSLTARNIVGEGADGHR